MGSEDPKEVSLETLAEGIKALFHNVDFADLTIRTGSETFKVHKAMVCARSDFFKIACKKDAFKEGEDSAITLATEEEDSIGTSTAIVRLMIEFLYTSDYKVSTMHREEDCSTPADEDRTLTTHAKVFAAAEKFQIRDLKLLSHEKFETFWNSKSGNKNDADIAEAIRIVYTTTANDVRELRDIVEERLKKRMKELHSRKQIQTAVESIEGLAFKLFLDARRESKGDRRPASSAYPYRMHQCTSHRSRSRSNSGDSGEGRSRSEAGYDAGSDY